MTARSRRSAAFLPILTFTIFLLADSSAAQVRGLPTEAVDSSMGGGNAIVGTVLTPTGQRIETRIQVRLVSMTRGDVIATTDEKGNFAFRGLPPGDYNIVISKEKEYEPLNQDVQIIQFRGSPPQVYTLNLRLSPKRQPAMEKPGVVDQDLAGIPRAALTHYSAAANLAKAGKYLDSIDEFQRAVVEYPRFFRALNDMGVQYLKLGKLEKADEAFQAALKINPEAIEPLVNHGIVLVNMKKYAEAEEPLRKAVGIKDEQGVARYFLGTALANLGRFPEAEKELTAALKLGGDELKEGHRILAIIYGSRGEKKKAADEIEKYLKLNPTTPDAEQLRNIAKQYRADARP